jgi:periplasmic divalent cation tolerance protein
MTAEAAANGVVEGGAALIWCPFADEEDAARVAGALLDESLVACANILPPMRSLYAWQGERGEGREAGVLFKTDPALLEEAMRRLDALHPYETPAIIGWRADGTTAPTAEWLGGLREGRSQS